MKIIFTPSPRMEIIVDGKNHLWYWKCAVQFFLSFITFNLRLLYVMLVCSLGSKFHSCAFGIFGGWGLDLIKVVKAIGRLQAQRLGCDSSEAILHLAQKNFNFSLERNSKCHTLDHSPASIPGLSGRHSVNLCITLSLLLLVNVGLSGLFILLFFSFLCRFWLKAV